MVCTSFLGKRLVSCGAQVLSLAVGIACTCNDTGSLKKIKLTLQQLKYAL